MTDNVDGDDNGDLRHDADAGPAVQAVEGRMLSRQAGSPVETGREQLCRGLEEAGETAPDRWLASTAERTGNADPPGVLARGTR